MIDLAILKFHAENVAHMTTIEQRIIGIDGNGTGRKGAIQRLEEKMDDGFSQMGEQVEEVRTSVSTLHGASFRHDNIPKMRIYHAVFAALGVLGVAVVTLFSTWLQHTMGWK